MKPRSSFAGSLFVWKEEKRRIKRMQNRRKTDGKKRRGGGLKDGEEMG